MNYRDEGLKLYPNAFERYDGIYIPQPNLNPALKLGKDWKEVVSPMKEGGRDEAKYFVIHFMERMVDIMLERGMELDFEKDPRLAPVRIKLKELRTLLGEYVVEVRGF